MTPFPAPFPRRATWLGPLLAWLLGIALPWTTPGGELHRITDLSGFQATTNTAGTEVILESTRLPASAPWNELILSWNASAPEGTYCEFEARGIGTGGATSYFNLGKWAESTNRLVRGSAGRQRDPDGEVATDVLRLRSPATAYQLRIHLNRSPGHPWPSPRFLAISLIDTQHPPVPRAPDRTAWGQVLDVPQSSQHAFAGGKAWCSPTSLSMVLGYWAETLPDPSLRVSVPEVAGGVFDPGWNGTGNWPFNTAYVSRWPALRGYVARLDDLRDLEQRIGEGIPVIISVSLNLLRQRPPAADDGHLVVVVGFNAAGDVWVNDPDTTHPPVAGRTIRRLYPRGTVDKAWSASRRTAYILCPVDRDPPPRQPGS